MIVNLENAVGSRKSAQSIDSAECRITSYMKKALVTNKVTSGTPPAFLSLRYLNQSLASWRLLLVHIFFAPHCVSQVGPTRPARLITRLKP